jgi:hypothetical protein
MLSVSLAFGQTGALTRDPAELVRKYLRLDMHGARLHPASVETQRPYIAWVDEPVWGHAVVIERFQVIDDLAQWEVRGNLDVVIPVEFTIVGSVYWQRAIFHAERQTERIGFHVKEVYGFWRIIEPLLPPHIGRKRLIQYVRQAMLEERDPHQQAVLDALLKDVRKAQE